MLVEGKQREGRGETHIPVPDSFVERPENVLVEHVAELAALFTHCAQAVEVAVAVPADVGGE